MAFALLLSICASLAGPGSVARAATTHDLAKSVPADSVVYIDLPLDTKSAQWTNATALLDAINGSGADNTINLANEDGIEGGEAALVVTNLNALSNAAGSVSGAVGSSGALSGGLSGIIGSLGQSAATEATPAAAAEPATTGLTLIIKPSDGAKAWASIQKDFATSASNDSATPTESTYKDGKISHYASADGSAGKAIAQVGGNIVVAQTAGDVEPIVDVARGDAESLSSVANFTKGAAALTGEQFAFGFINGQAAAAGLSTSAGSQLGSMDGAVSALVGADHDTAFQLAASGDGLGIQTVDLPNGDSAADSAKASGTAASLDGAAKVPANALIFVNGYNLGTSAVMEALGLAVVSLFSGLSADMATPIASPTAEDMYATTAGLLGFNLKTDFLDQLTGKYVFALWSNGGAGASVSSFDGVLASEASNPAALQVTVSGLGFLVQAIGQGSASVTTATFGDSALSEVSIGSGDSATKIDFGVAKAQFVLGIGTGAESYLTGNKESLADSRDYKAAMSALPAEYDGVVYVNVAQLSTMTSNVSGAMIDGGTPVSGVATATADASKVKSFALVSYKKGGLAYTSSMLVVEAK